MSWEKKIADSLVGTFGKVKADVVNEVKTVETIVASEAKKVFEQAHQAALDANAEVNKVKADLQVALAKAAGAHQSAIDAVVAAQAAAEADVARFKALFAAHTADLATQQSQIVTPPAPEPTPAPADPAPVTAADLSGNGVTATVTPADPATPAS